MTWSRVVETGSGAIAWRLMIPGHPIEWASSTRLAGASTDGRIRIAGLDTKGIQWGERVDPAMVKLTGSGFTASIIEDGATRTGDSFVRQPTKINYLAASISATDVAIPLVSTNTVNGDVIYIGQECMLITSGGGTAAPTVTRGYRQTRAQAHVYDPGLGLTRPEVTTEDAGAYNGRPSVKGLLAFLYAYGDGETGDGTLVWRGICGEPRMRGLTSWDLPISSVASILDQALSTDLQDPARLRGILYNSTTAPTLRITQLTGPTGSSAPSASDTETIPFPSAFYETQAEWCAAFNAEVQAATAGWANPLNAAGGGAPRLAAVPTVDGSWGLQYTTATPLWLAITCSGELDPTHQNLAQRFYEQTTGAEVSTVGSNTTYDVPRTYPIEGAGTVPRGFVGTYSTRVPGRSGGGSATANVFYMGGTTTLSVDDALYVEWPAFAGRDVRGLVYRVTAWDSTTRAATLDFTAPGVAAGSRVWTRDGVPTIRVARTYVSAGNFGDFMTDLVASAPDEAPQGRSPMVTIDHVDFAGLSTNVDAVADGRAWADQRFYGGSSDYSLAKLIAEELKLLGMVPSITTSGQWTAVEFRIGAATEAGAYEIDASKNLSGKQKPGFEPSAFGLVNTIDVKQGFDWLTGKHNGDQYVVRDSAALSRQPLPFVMRIEPRSTAFLGDYSIPVADVVAMAQGWLGSLGAAYTSVTVMCPLSAMAATIGTQVGITISQLPDPVDGGRGLEAIGGFVIGRAVKPMQACVELTVFTTQVRIAGYAPSSRVTSVTLGATRDVLLDAVQPDGYADASQWTIGDAVILRQYNTSGPSEITATVTGVNVGTRTITIGTISGLTPGGTLNLEFGAAADAQQSQQAWCYIAASDGLIGFATGDTAARQFAS